jgi:hypothetical protein
MLVNVLGILLQSFDAIFTNVNMHSKNIFVSLVAFLTFFCRLHMYAEEKGKIKGIPPPPKPQTSPDFRGKFSRPCSCC